MPKEETTDPVDDLFEDLDLKADELNKDDEGEKTVVKEDDKKTEPTPSEQKVTDLEAELEKMQRERQGVLDAAKAERRKRQDMKSNLDNLTSTVNNILQQRQAVKNDDSDIDGVPVEFSEDGEQAFVKEDNINNLLKPLYQEVMDLKQALANNTGAAEGQRKAQETVDSIVGSDERYGTVYNKYKAARKWVNDKVVDFQKDNDITGLMTSGQALDHVLTGTVEDEFKENFKDFELVDVVTAEDSQRHFLKMLDNTASILGELNEEVAKTKDSSKFKEIIKKPSGLGTATNAKAGELSITEKAGKLGSSDIMDLSDAQANALEDALLNEEVRDGVKF